VKTKRVGKKGGGGISTLNSTHLDLDNKAIQGDDEKTKSPSRVFWVVPAASVSDAGGILQKGPHFGIQVGAPRRGGDPNFLYMPKMAYL
jgi:hypothetical protein